MRKILAGFIGFGEVNSPPELIGNKCAAAREKLVGAGFEIVEYLRVSDVPDGSEARMAGEVLARCKMDLIVLCVAGWIPSYAVIDAVHSLRHIPMLLWGLCGEISGGRLVTTADQAGTTALRKTLEEMGFNFKYIYESIDRDRIKEVTAYGSAARAASMLRGSRAGMMGYRDMRLYGTVVDAVRLKSVVGAEIENFEMLEMVQRGEKIPQAEIKALKDKVLSEWVFEGDTDERTLEESCRYYLALRQIACGRGLDAISLIDVDGMKKLLNLPPSMIFMLLTNELGISAVPENDAPGLATQLMVRFLTGQIGAYLEFYEFMSDGMLAGVPDFIPAEITDGAVTVRTVGFGGFSKSVLNISKAKTGRVTMFRLTTVRSGFAMHIVPCDAENPKPWEEAGWERPAPQLPGLKLIPDCGIEAFADNVASQHYIMAYGDHAAPMRDLCRILSIETIP